MQLLRHFLEKGTLGPIALGLSPLEVQHKLGNPEDVGGTPKNRLWKYGSIQFGFHRNKAAPTGELDFIGLYFRYGRLTLPKSISLEGWIPSETTTIEEFIHYLEEQGIGYSEDRQLTFETQSTLTTDSGASIVFTSSEGEFTLDSIQLIEKKILKPPATS